MRYEHHTSRESNNQYLLFRKGVICCLNGLMALEDRAMPEQYGGGIVSRSANGFALGYTRTGSYWVCAAPYVRHMTNRYAQTRELFIELLWDLHVGATPKTSSIRIAGVATCLECGAKFVPHGKQRYCSHKCGNYLARRARAKDRDNV